MMNTQNISFSSIFFDSNDIKEIENTIKQISKDFIQGLNRHQKAQHKLQKTHKSGKYYQNYVQMFGSESLKKDTQIKILLNSLEFLPFERSKFILIFNQKLKKSIIPQVNQIKNPLKQAIKDYVISIKSISSDWFFRIIKSNNECQFKQSIFGELIDQTIFKFLCQQQSCVANILVKANNLLKNMQKEQKIKQKLQIFYEIAQMQVQFRRLSGNLVKNKYNQFNLLDQQ